jgi:hypothetical protein
MSRFNTNNLDRLGTRIGVPIKPDQDGYLGRECPVDECRGYFKITPGTGIKGPAPCHCPYCGHSAENQTFWTQEQIDYAKSVALRQIADALHQDLKSMEFDHPPRGGFGFGMSLKVTRGAPLPIKHYREKELETEVACDNCTLQYAIYGVFGWCPDCGIHNSLQILIKNLELAKKQLALARSVDKELADHLTGDALKNIVCAFDGFGREICAKKATDIHFQNLPGARRRVQDAFAFDFADALTPADWQNVCKGFQKRHLLEHKMGVVDEEYMQRANDPQAILGRKITISRDEVAATVNIVEALGRRLFDGILPATS